MLNQIKLKLPIMDPTKILFLITIVLAYGCVRKVLDNSSEESKVLDEISREYGCLATLELDYDVVRRGNNNGEYFIELLYSKEDTVCELDSLQKISILEDVKCRLLPVLSYQENHSNLVMSIKMLNDKVNGLQTSKCIERYTFSLQNDSIIAYYREFEDNVFQK